MKVIGSLRGRVGVVVLTVALTSAACRPASVPTRQPVTRAPQLVPGPVSMALTAGAPFSLARTSAIVVDAAHPQAAAIGEMLGAQLRPPTGIPLPVAAGNSSPVPLAPGLT